MKTFQLLFFALFLSSNLAFAQLDDKLQELFYCNQNSNVRKLYFASDDYAVGVIDYMYMVSIDKDGLFKDTLDIDAEIYNLQVIGKNQFVVNGHWKTDWVKLVDGKFEKIPNQRDKGKRPKDFKFQKGNYSQKKKGLSVNHLTKIDGMEIGYYTPGKWKKKWVETPEKAPPLYYVIKNGKEIEINPEGVEAVTNNRIRGIDGDYRFPSNAYVYYYTGSAIIFTVTQTNTFYHFDIATEKVSSYKFPALESKQEVCAFYYDHISKRSYVIKKQNKNAYQIYLLAPEYKSMKLVTTMEYFPEAIVADKVHYRVQSKENKQKYFCHYLRPLYQSPEALRLIKAATVEGKQ